MGHGKHMANNWPKAIQFTAVTLLAIVAGVAISLASDLLWPLVVVVLVCVVAMTVPLARNGVLERQAKKESFE